MKTLFLLSCMLLSASVWAESFMVAPNSAVHLTVSNREPNVIAVMNDRIVEANTHPASSPIKRPPTVGH